MADDTAKGLAARLAEVAQALGAVEKRGRNDHHSYDYVKAEDVVQHVRDLLLERDVLLIPSATGVRHEGTLTTVDLLYRFTATDTGEAIEVPWVGVGFDKDGDKGVYKAMTGALKYLILQTFLVPTGDDPEADRTTARRESGVVAPPVIPADRARKLLDAAVDAGLAEKKGRGAELSTPLKAKLAEYGVEKLGAIPVDKADAVEAWVASQKVAPAEEGSA